MSYLKQLPFTHIKVDQAFVVVDKPAQVMDQEEGC